MESRLVQIRRVRKQMWSLWLLPPREGRGGHSAHRTAWPPGVPAPLHLGCVASLFPAGLQSSLVTDVDTVGPANPAQLRERLPREWLFRSGLIN